MHDETAIPFADILPDLRGRCLSTLVGLCDVCLLGYDVPVQVTHLARKVGLSTKSTHDALHDLHRMGVIRYQQRNSGEAPLIRLYPSLNAGDPLPLGASLSAPIRYVGRNVAPDEQLLPGSHRVRSSEKPEEETP